MKHFKKAFNLILLLIFLSQSAAFCLPEKDHSLRPPLQFNTLSNEAIILSNLEEYLKIEGSGSSRTNDSERDAMAFEEIQKTGTEGVNVLEGILKDDKRTWVRAKAALLLARLYTPKNKEILNVLLESLDKDESVMVRSIIARSSLVEIKKNATKVTGKTIDKKVKAANLDPWDRKNRLQILDAGCQYGEATHGILEYYKNKGFVDVLVVGVDIDAPVIIEAERNKADENTVFILGDIDKDDLGQADIIFSMNLLLYKENMERHAKSLVSHLNPDGGKIYYTPSIYASGQDGIMSAWAFESALKIILPKGSMVTETKTNPFGERGDFESPWGEGGAWITGAMPSSVSIKTGKGDEVTLKTLHFPDGEIYLRTLNPGTIKDSLLKIATSLDSCEDLVRLFLLMGLLKRNGAKEISVVLDKPYDIKNGLDSLLRFYCDRLFYNNVKSNAMPLEPIKKDKGPHWVSRVLYQHERLESDAREAAGAINAKAERLEIEKPEKTPLTWKANIKNDLQGQNVILVHSTENFIDFAELWIMLIALRRAGVNSISLINTYEGYSRQDKEFNPGESVSAETMLRTIDALVDNHMALNVHYANNSGRVVDKSGEVAFVNNYDLYNLNAFVQPAENLFDKIGYIVKRVGKENLADELKKHPLLLVSPDDGALGYVEEAAGVLKKYVEKKYGITIEVHIGYMDKKRLGDKKVTMPGAVLTRGGQVIIGINVKDCWVIILDDEISWGTTVKAATYALVRKVGVSWSMIMDGAVHGRFAGGLEPFKTGRTEEEIIEALKKGVALEPKEEYIDEKEELMPPSLIVVTKSVTLPKDFPESQQVSIGPIIAYAAKRIVGAETPFEQLNEKISRTPQQTNL